MCPGGRTVFEPVRETTKLLSTTSAMGPAAASMAIAPARVGQSECTVRFRVDARHLYDFCARLSDFVKDLQADVGRIIHVCS